jgi:hypothetical protein
VQLRNARLCLDCEELHDQSICPLCASERFVYLSRWLGVYERRSHPRLPLEPAPKNSPEKTSAGWWKAGAGAGLLWLIVRRWRRPPE